MNTIQPRAQQMNRAAAELRYREAMKLWADLLQQPENRSLFLRTFGRHIASRRADWELWLGKIGEVGPEERLQVPTPARAVVTPAAMPLPSATEAKGPTPAPVAEQAVWEMCFRVASTDPAELALDRIARSDLIFEGSRAFYAYITARTATDPVQQARTVNQIAQKLAAQLNGASALAGDWKILVIPWGDLYDAGKCQYAGGDGRSAGGGGQAKVKPLSFAVQDLKQGTMRKRALVEPAN